jgi:predicted secreted hydrolase
MSSLKRTHTAPLAVIASGDADYERWGLARGAVAAWEDGARTDNRRGTYEWWYFDAHLDDGSSLVVVFMNKDLASPKDPLTPTIRIDLDLADGHKYQKLVTFPPDSWQSSTSAADVRIGENRFSGDLHTYRIQGAVEEITVDVTLVGQVPAWRPETGYLLFGAGRDKEFAWLPSVPQGAVTATYRIGDEVHETTGVGYHDHNWGNVSLVKIVHDWYWARGQAGPYTVIASLVTAHERYRYTELPILNARSRGRSARP